MSIIEHVEEFLGHISHGWKDKGSPENLQIVCFRDSPFETIDTFLTIGLSHHQLILSEKKKVRQELILPISGANQSEDLVSCLLYICELALKGHSALRRGQVIRLQKQAAKKLGFDAVYCAIPVFMNDAFATFSGTAPPTVMVWTMPLYQSEADFVDANGWDKFEDLLEEKDPDLFSLGRDAVV